MGYTLRRQSGGQFVDMAMEITNIGLDYREFEGKGQHRIIVVYKPLVSDSPLGIQTNILNTNAILVVEGNRQTITVGASEAAFELDIVGNIITAGDIGGKAEIWLEKLTKLGVDTAGESGNLSVLVGVQAEWRNMTYSEAMNRKESTKYTEKRFWMPVKILSAPKKQKTVKEELMEFIDEGKTEKEVLQWCQEKKHNMSLVFSTLEQDPAFEVMRDTNGNAYFTVTTGIFGECNQ